MARGTRSLATLAFFDRLAGLPPGGITCRGDGPWLHGLMAKPVIAPIGPSHALPTCWAHGLQNGGDSDLPYAIAVQ